MSRIANLSERILCSPVLWGGMAWLATYAILSSGLFESPLMDRYLRNHVIEKITMLLFCVAVMALVIRLVMLVKEFVALEKVRIELSMPGGASVDEAPRYLKQLDQLPLLLRNSYIYRRLCEALEYVRRKDSADTVERHLRHLENVDLDRMSSNFAVPRLMMWAIPVLGFLGTVIGITGAIGQLRPSELEDSIEAVTADLGLAFDTTTLALALSLIIGIAKFAVERIENGLLAQVDRRTEAEMIGRFQAYGTSSDPHVASVRRMSEQVVRAVERMATDQAQVLRDTLEEGHSHWVEVATATGKILDDSLSTTLHDTLERHAQTLSNGVDRQLTGLRNTLESHVALLNAGAEKQITLLNDGLSRGGEVVSQQLAALSEQSHQQVESVTKLTSEHLQSMTEATTAQVTALRQTVDEHKTSLQDGSEDLIEKLRTGLERMAELLVEALQKHGETLTAGEQQLAAEHRRHIVEVEAALGEAMVVAADRQEKLIHCSEQLLSEIQKELSGASATAAEHQRELARQSEVLLQVVDSTGHVRDLEKSLNANLASLGRVHNFEETLLSLSAAIQLLSARVGHDGNRPATGTPTQQAA